MIGRRGAAPRRIVWSFLLVAAFASTAHARQEGSTLGSTIDLVTGTDNNPDPGAIGQLKTPATFYRLYPSVSISSAGGKSVWRGQYAFELAQARSETKLGSHSHSASLDFSRPVYSQWNISLLDSFMKTSDATTFGALRGVTASPEASRFLFDPLSASRSAQTNMANVQTDYDWSSTSTLSFGASHTLRNYSSSLASGTTLSNQQAVTGNIGYSQRTADNSTWTFGYTGAYYHFRDLEDAYSHTAQVGYAAGITRTLRLEMTVGASRVESLGTGGGYLGYNTSVRLQKAEQNDTFALYYRQDAGQPTGVGSTSDSRQAGVAMTRAVAGAFVFLDASVFDGRGTLDNRLTTQGASAAASIGIPLTQTLSVHGGGTYQRYSQPVPFAFSRTRLFISLRYENPNLFRFSR